MACAAEGKGSVLHPIGIAFFNKGGNPFFRIAVQHILDHDFARIGIGLIQWHLYLLVEG